MSVCLFVCVCICNGDRSFCPTFLHFKTQVTHMTTKTKFDEN